METAGSPVFEEHVETLLNSLSLREQVGQLNQRLLGWKAVERHGRSWRLTDEAEAEIERWAGLGALYGLFRADAWSGQRWDNGIRPEERWEVAQLVQESVRAAGPHGIGALIVEEAPHGHQALGGTVLPQNLALAASWNLELVREASAAVATELAASGVSLALVSGLDVMRDGRWGRSEECLGEDPYLASRLVTAIVEGMQGMDGERLGHDGVGVVIKHLAGQGEAVGGRNGQSAIIGPRDLAEIHLPPAAAAIQAGAVGVMAAYNDIDGIPCSANPWLLRTWLRQEQGFRGIVMADGLAVDQLLPMAGSIKASARLAVTSGVDVSLWDEGFTTLADSAERNPSVAAAVRDACGRVLTLKKRLGLLAPADDTPAPARGRIDLDAAVSRTKMLSSELASAVLVLLEGQPPSLDTIEGDIVVVGPNAHDVTGFLGDYVAPLAPGHHGSVADSLRRRLGTRVSGVAADAPDFDERISGAAAIVGVWGGTSHRSYDDEFAANGAVAASLASCGEGADVADLRLPGDQDALIRRIASIATGPLLSVVVAGRPHVLTEVVANSEVTIWAGYAGPYGPDAVAAVLAGDRVPTGRLPFTLLRSSGVTPVRHNDRISAAGVYRDVPEPVLFPFAAGGTNAIHVKEASAVSTPSGIRLTVLIHNPAEHSVRASIPVFAKRRGGNSVPRQRELVHFWNLMLSPGSTSLEVLLPSAMAFGEANASERSCVFEIEGVLTGEVRPF